MKHNLLHLLTIMYCTLVVTTTQAQCPMKLDSVIVTMDEPNNQMHAYVDYKSNHSFVLPYTIKYYSGTCPGTLIATHSIIDTLGIRKDSLKNLANNVYYATIESTNCPLTPTCTGTAVKSFEICNGCINIGFENNNLNSWITTGNAVLVNNTQTDRFGGFALSGSGKYALRLGNDSVTGTSTAEKTLCVDPVNSALVMRFAMMVLDFGHSPADAAYINIKVTDMGGNLIAPCATYTATDGQLGLGFQASPTVGIQGGAASGGSTYPVKYLPWTTFNFDLRPYIGQQVKIVATNNWCRYNVDWAYGYIDAECQPFEIKEKYPLCANGTGTICAPEGYATYNWTPPAGGTIVSGQGTKCIEVTGAGNYVMTATSFTNCPIQPISFNLKQVNSTPPVVNFTVDNCTRNVQFTDSTTIAGAGNTIKEWKWNFDEPTSLARDSSTLQNPTHQYSAVTGTNYNVTLAVVASNGCRARLTKAVVTDTVPNVAFTWNNVCKGTTMAFTNTSTSAFSAITNTTWYFNDSKVTGTANDSAYTTNTNHLYSYSGKYNVVLKVTNANGCTDTIIRTVRIYDVPKVNITTKDICQYVPNFPVLNPLQLDSAKFIANATIKGLTDTITKYEVDWQNDGIIDYTRNTKSISQTFKQGYPTVGINNVMIKVSTAYCSGADTVLLKVYPNPVANYIVNNVCNDSAFALIDKTNINTIVAGISPAPYVDSVYYNYGDNLTLYGFKAPVITTIKHKYATPGLYPIVEMAKSNFGCINYFVDSVIIFPEPKANFTSTAVCFNTPTNYTSTSSVIKATGSTNSIVGYQWDFSNNGSYDNTITPTPQITIAGNDTTKLTKLVVTTNHGCTDTVLHKATVYGLPTALFGVKPVCHTFTSLFNDSSTYWGNETIAQHNWTFEPNQFSTLPSPSYTYAAPNNYPVKLVVTTVHGCLDSITKTAVVNPNPKVGFFANVRVGCQPLQVLITDTSTIGGVPAGSFNQSFNYYIDSAKHKLTPNYNYVFDKVGLHSIGLKVVTNKGCSDSVYQKNYIEVYPKPTAAFSISPQITTIADGVITLEDKNKLGEIIDWNYGDGKTAINMPFKPSHTHQYNDSGVFIITQYVTTAKGCKDTAYETLTIKPSSILFIPNAFTPNADGTNDYFNAKAYGIIKYELRIFDRWGTVVGIVTDVDALGWDGTDVSTGQSCKTEVYTWRLNYTNVLNEKRNQVGSVTLLR